MVGWTVVNRMKKSSLKHVSEVWDNRYYAHHKFPTATSLWLADRILGGAAIDISQGATHFYTPSIMPKAGERQAGTDVGGGLETVPGVVKNGKPIQNYLPKWAEHKYPIHVPGIQEKDLKFFRIP